MGKRMQRMQNLIMDRETTKEKPQPIIQNIKFRSVVKDELDTRKGRKGKPSKLGKSVDRLLGKSWELENWFTLWRTSTSRSRLNESWLHSCLAEGRSDEGSRRIKNGRLRDKTGSVLSTHERERAQAIRRNYSQIIEIIKIVEVINFSAIVADEDNVTSCLSRSGDRSYIGWPHWDAVNNVLFRLESNLSSRQIRGYYL